jgi:GAF domain-containing protein
MQHLSVEIGLSKEEKYQALLPQMSALLAGETDAIANQANFIAALQEVFHWLWLGFYFVKENELVLGPFQGPVACTRIQKGKGVCGTAWLKNQPILVPDVEAFPGHIACSANSKSEIVIPIHNNVGEVIGVLDADSEYLNHFDEVDKRYLQELLKCLFP